jgi:hypothetical protein
MIELLMALVAPAAGGILAIWLLLVIGAWWEKNNRRP